MDRSLPYPRSNCYESVVPHPNLPNVRIAAAGPREEEELFVPMCCEVIGEAGTIRVDLNAPMLTVTAVDGSTTERQTFDGFQRNQLFVDELKTFLAAISGGGVGLVPIRQAAQSLRVALAARESLGSGRVVELS